MKDCVCGIWPLFLFQWKTKKNIKSKQKQKIPEFLSKKIGWKGAYRNFQRENVLLIFFNRIYFKSIFMFFYFDRIQISKFNRLICSSQFKSQNKQISKDKKKRYKVVLKHNSLWGGVWKCNCSWFSKCFFWETYIYFLFFKNYF
jgi:hypothetical protein